MDVRQLLGRNEDIYDHPKGPAIDDPSNIPSSSRVALVLGVSWTVCNIAVVCVLLRSWIRIKIFSQFSIDDYLMVLAMAANIVFQVFVHQSVVISSHQHNNGAWLKPFALCVAPAALVSLFGRVSSAILLSRIFHPVRWLCIYMIITSILLTIMTVLFIISFFAYVTPLSSLWTPGQDSRQILPDWFHVWMPNILLILTAWIDFTYIIIPVILTWRLSMSFPRRVGLWILTLGSLVIVAASVLKVLQYHDASTKTTSAQNALIYAGVEQALGVSFGCIPAMLALLNQDWPVLRKIRRGFQSLVHRLSTKSNASGTGASGSSLAKEQGIRLPTIGSKNKQVRMDYGSKDEVWLITEQHPEETTENG